MSENLRIALIGGTFGLLSSVIGTVISHVLLLSYERKKRKAEKQEYMRSQLMQGVSDFAIKMENDKLMTADSLSQKEISAQYYYALLRGAHGWWCHVYISRINRLLILILTLVFITLAFLDTTAALFMVSILLAFGTGHIVMNRVLGRN